MVLLPVVGTGRRNLQQSNDRRRIRSEALDRNWVNEHTPPPQKIVTGTNSSSCRAHVLPRALLQTRSNTMRTL